MEIYEKIVAILFSLTILLNGLFLRRYTGTWLSPGCLFSLFWFLYTFFPLVILFTVPVNAIAVGFISISVILFSSTTLLFNWKDAFAANFYKPDPEKIFNTKFLKLVLISSISVSVMSSLLYVMIQGFGLVEMISSPVAVAAKFASARYAEMLTESIFGPISLLFSNIAVIFGGLLFASAKKGKIYYFAFLPSIIILLTQSAKGLFFLSIFLFLGGMLVARLFGKHYDLISLKVIKRITYISVLFFILITISFLSRGLQDIDDSGAFISHLVSLFSSYMFCHVYGFSDWFTAYTGGDATMRYDTSNYYMGFYTLTSFFKMLGSTKMTPAGVYGEFFVYKDLLESNIYTIYRGIIMDFGLFGGLVFMIINGFIVNVFYYIFLRQRKPVFTSMFLIFMLGYFYMSFGISMLTWVTIPFTFAICYLILKINSSKIVHNKTVKEQ